MRNWDELYLQIGPLRYQASTTDCVPTTIINGLSVLLGRRVPPKLHQLIWALAGDQDSGTGWVCCDTLSTLLGKWFQRAHQDGREKEPLPFTSRIIEGDEVSLKKNGRLMRCISNGGVACLVTGRNADHYSLLIGAEGGSFIGFDSWWDGKKTAKRLADFASYNGLINIRWTRKNSTRCCRRAAGSIFSNIRNNPQRTVNAGVQVLSTVSERFRCQIQYQPIRQLLTMRR